MRKLRPSVDECFALGRTSDDTEQQSKSWLLLIQAPLLSHVHTLDPSDHEETSGVIRNRNWARVSQLVITWGSEAKSYTSLLKPRPLRLHLACLPEMDKHVAGCFCSILDQCGSCDHDLGVSTASGTSTSKARLGRMLSMGVEPLGDLPGQTDAREFTEWMWKHVWATVSGARP